MKYLLIGAVAIMLAACTSDHSAAPDIDSRNSATATNDHNPLDSNTVTPTPVSPPVRASAANVLALDGLGDLRLGRPIPAGDKWTERGAQTSDACRTISSSEFAGVYAIIEQGKVRRITLGQQSNIRLAENIGVGSTEKEVLNAFPGFRAEPHKYVASPAKYLTAPNAVSGDPALRFEIGADGKVSIVHVGTMPVLGYVEGCA